MAGPSHFPILGTGAALRQRCLGFESGNQLMHSTLLPPQRAVASRTKLRCCLLSQPCSSSYSSPPQGNSSIFLQHRRRRYPSPTWLQWHRRRSRSRKSLTLQVSIPTMTEPWLFRRSRSVCQPHHASAQHRGSYFAFCQSIWLPCPSF